MNVTESARAAILARIDAAARAAGHHVRLLAVSKTKPADAVRVLAAQGQLAFGENYVQEALAKQRELVDLALEWHLIGPLQSNKCREVALHFDWLQSLDRLKLVAPLAPSPRERGPLDVLIQVNIDDEASNPAARRRTSTRSPPPSRPKTRCACAASWRSPRPRPTRRAPRRVPPHAHAVRRAARNAYRHRHAVDGHVRRLRARDRGRRDDGAHRHRVVRREKARLRKPLSFDDSQFRTFRSDMTLPNHQAPTTAPWPSSAAATWRAA
jgi:hypothetical protein